MIAQPQAWLETIPWECVIEQNQKICEAARLQHAVLPEQHDQVRKLWETMAAQILDLKSALDMLRQCVALAPFRYNNLNTFAMIARKLVENAAAHLPAVEGRILTATVAHYVENKIGKSELRQVIVHFDQRLPRVAEPVAPPPAASVRTQPLAT